MIPFSNYCPVQCSFTATSRVSTLDMFARTAVWGILCLNEIYRMCCKWWCCKFVKCLIPLQYSGADSICQALNICINITFYLLENHDLYSYVFFRMVKATSGPENEQKEETIHGLNVKFKLFPRTLALHRRPKFLDINLYFFFF